MKWLLLVVLGVGSVACDLPPTTSTTPDSKLVIRTYITPVGIPNVNFIYDTESGDCWIVIQSNGVALQRASVTSCQRGESNRR